jgi:hypothetical protein
MLKGRCLVILYTKEELINFYTNTIITTITKENPRITQEEFQQKFQQKLNLYKTDGQHKITEMNQIEQQITNLKIEDGKVTLPITIKIEGTVNEDLYASYTYTKTFQHPLQEVENI